MGFAAFVMVALWSACFAHCGLLLVKKCGLNPYESVGLGGLIGLGTLGTVLGLAGQATLPSFVLVSVAVGLVTAALTFREAKDLWRQEWKSSSPFGKWFGIAAVLLLIVSLVAVCAPATTLEWDSLAYHLAVPKLWQAAGRVTFIPGMHQSNFPFSVEILTALFPPAMQEVAAKSVTWFYAVFGSCALYGFAQRKFEKGAEWVPIAFLASPVVLWESGTAYIDVAHGLFAGLAVLYASEWKGSGWKHTVLVGVLLGLAAATKYTGLQTLGLVVAGLAAVSLLKEPKRLPQVGAIVAIAILFCGGWYVKTYQNTGNPVFPFFYEKLGGRDWDQWRADVYANEQKSFGIHGEANKREPLKAGHAILGLSYQPGRYTNPDWDHGNGLAIGAVGGLALASLLALAFAGPRDGSEKFALAVVGLQLAAWFVLSQQSRYMTSLVVVSAGLLPALFRSPQLGKALKGAAVLQAAYSAYLLYSSQSVDQLKVATGQINAEDYRDATVGFSKSARALNADSEVKKVALYHEVFGFLLDKPYFWANPGHSMVIPYQDLATGHEYATKMKSLGFSHVYYNLSGEDKARAKRWLAAAGITPGDPYSPEEKAEMSRDLNLKWLVLLAQAVRDGDLVVVGEPSNHLILKFT